jgi:hypothetical protein
VIGLSLRDSGKGGQSKRIMLKFTRPSLRRRTEDLNTSRTAGLVLEAVTRFLTTSGSATQGVNALTWSVLMSEQFSGNAALMLDCGWGGRMEAASNHT